MNTAENVSMDGGIGSGAMHEPGEKMVPQSVVDNAIKAAKNHAYNKGIQDQLAASQPQQSQMNMQPQVAPPVDTQAIIQKQVQDQLLALQQQQHHAATQQYAQQVISEFNRKMSMNSDKYPDLQQRVANLDLAKMPEIVELATKVDNTADVMHDLATNPMKIGNLLSVWQRNPKLAEEEIQRLSGSIKQNQDAQNTKSAPEPLDQIRTSPTSSDSGKMGISDFQNQPWLRG